jgi:hypothetical protein
MQRFETAEEFVLQVWALAESVTIPKGIRAQRAALTRGKALIKIW